MSDRIFDAPIFVEDGRHLVCEIATLADAVDFLEGWPEASRDLIHETALKACYDAYIGLKPLGVARLALEGFARKAGILVDPATVMPWMSSKNGTGGRAPI